MSPEALPWAEAESNWNIIRCCVVASFLSKGDKARLLTFLESIEEDGYEPVRSDD